MDYEELFKKYQVLLIENSCLKAEIQGLKERYGVIEQQQVSFNELIKNNSENIIKKNSNAKDKIELFMSLFKGRDDVYAKRWQSKDGRSGYVPVCINEWKIGICNKPKVKCADCTNKSYKILDENAIEEHLMGNVIIGIYPMFLDETCNFLAIDFDDEGWQQDINILRDVCKEFAIEAAVERSRSGNGAHAWFFFEKPITAVLARKLGTALLTYAMGKRHEIKFKAYDRLFPNQDTLPKGGFGNLIALPLQKSARRNDNSVFINEGFMAYPDQWAFLSGIKKLTEEQIESLTANLCHGNELGLLRKDEEEVTKPWEKSRMRLSKNDFPQEIEIIKANMLYVTKDRISQRALDALKRIAAFNNPEFYKAQAMHMPTYNKPRVISCSDETSEYMCLPRGCEIEIKSLLEEYKVSIDWSDKTNHGRKINIEFNGVLREEQQLAINGLLKYDNGVLSATTAFGKTVVAAKLIAERKINTLILVHRQQLLSQWKSRLSEFLNINEELPVPEKKRGRKKSQSLIGQVGGGKDNRSRIIDIAIFQSLGKGNEIKEFIKDYGMVIVDECHHVPAFSFEQVLKAANAKYVYGLTATPLRQDGHHPIIFMYCGPVRYKIDAKAQAEKRPFLHYMIPRFTGFRVPIYKEEKELSIQELYSEITTSEIRNQLIVDDVVKAYEKGRNSIVLTERTAHVELLARKLISKIPDVITLTGGMGVKETREIFAAISAVPPDRQLTIIATGRYIGEGFDEPRLDTLFLAMPISWKGTLQQYAGRLHRLYENKNEVQIYDYIDINIRMLEKMYSKRLNGYAAIGYKIKGEIAALESNDIIFDKSSFLPVYCNDIINAEREVLIVSPFFTKRRVTQMLQYFIMAASKQIKIIIVTRPVEDFNEKNRSSLVNALDILNNLGIKIIYKSNIHQKFAIIDQKIVWYGSINLLSFGMAEESIMRLESSTIASELCRSMDKAP